MKPLNLPRRPDWVHRYRWLLAVLVCSLLGYALFVAFNLATGH